MKPKVLITGSTANQSNPVTHERSTNFAGLLTHALTIAGCDVTWEDPSVSLRRSQLDQYDRVLVGVASPLALGSNRIYGALGVINELWGDPTLFLYTDVPDVNNIARGLESVSRNPRSLTKEFFSYRKDYDLACSPRGKVDLFSACSKLRDEEWPTTLVPGFPWTYASQFERDLPAGAEDQVQTINLDSFIIDRFDAPTPHDDLTREARWMAERGADKKWLKSLALSYPVLSLRSDHRVNLHSYTTDRLRTAAGFLHSPSRRGAVWWSPKVAISLSQRTPVFTQWRVSKVLGDSWAALPGTFEAMSQEEAQQLSESQYDLYLDAILGMKQAAHSLLEILNLEDQTNG
jgi:hypothetical protein